MLWLPVLAIVLALISQSSPVVGRQAKVVGSSCTAREVDGVANKIICVCNENSCKDLKFEWPQKSGQVYLVESTQSGKRFKVSDITGGQARPSGLLTKQTEIVIAPNNVKQSILGWGGAFTDSTGINLRNLSSALADRLLESYFGLNGLQYNFARVPIGGTDFSTRAYTYNDSPEPDLEQSNWSLADEDLLYKIPFIKRAIQIAKSQLKRGLKLFASSWSPPKWLKDNDSLVRGSLIDKDVIYSSYVNYLMKFFDAYGNHSINFWGATVQNEPVASGLPFYFFNSLNFKNSSQMARLISDYIGPALEQRGLTKETFKLIVGDDSLGLINAQVKKIMAKPEVAKYVSGLAFHWYTSGTIVPYDALNDVYEPLRDKFEFVLMTEACEGSGPLDKKVDLGSWDRGEAYAHDILEDLARHTNGWVDWNLALDLQGGPNWSKNFVDSPIIVNAATNEFYLQPMYYALAHFSRLFKPESVIVGTEIKTGPLDKELGIFAAAAQNEETGHLIINILNKFPESRKIKLTINAGNLVRKQQVRTVSIESRSISSIVIKL